MTNKEKRILPREMILSFLIGINILIIETGYTTGDQWYWALAVSLPLLVLGILNNRQRN